MTTGVKTINDLMGLDHTAKLDSCEDQKTKAVTTLWEMAESIGMSTGAVTTATITHATPGATYAHIANRDWESDAAMPPEALQAGCMDIARQLVDIPYGDGFEVAMGGGANFLPETAADPEYADKKGKRKDGADLTKAWLDRYGDGGAYVWNSSSSNSSTRPGSTTCSGFSRCRTCSTITTGRRTRLASPRSRRWPRRRSTFWPGTPRATCS